MAKTEAEIAAERVALKFRGEPDLATLQELVRAIDRSPAVTWTGPGGIKGRLLKLIEDHSTEATEGSDQE